MTTKCQKIYENLGLSADIEIQKERPYFILKGAAPKALEVPIVKSTHTLANTTINSSNTNEDKKEKSLTHRKNSNKMKLLDDPRVEQMLMGRNTIPIPSFMIIDKEGALYPEKTDERMCQWDRYPIPWRPKGLPVFKYVTREVAHYICIRWFCSLECAKSFCKEHCKQESYYVKCLEYLEEMNKLTLEYLGHPHKPLEDADDWNILKGVGSGLVEIDEFRSQWQHRYIKETSYVLCRGVEIYTKISRQSQRT